jgi:hypothetical protein
MFGERALLTAIRNRLRSELDYAPEACEIEFDEEIPPVVGDRYVAVLPGGVNAGPYQGARGYLLDLVHSVDVAVYFRIRAVPRDRRRDVFLSHTQNLTDEVERIIGQIDRSYDLLNAANVLLADDGETQGFCEPLRFSRIDGRPRLAGPDVFAASGKDAVGLVRTVSFTGARLVRQVS